MPDHEEERRSWIEEAFTELDLDIPAFIREHRAKGELRESNWERAQRLKGLLPPSIVLGELPLPRLAKPGETPE